ncbi:AsnC family transcriptional regulator [Alsobacter soli]|uniref:AsnC family transcriptional regulator n=1 Tax=Alsobacter soli TaxID=2109933 RepID=A0A2T1HX24_9HYPH|nr:Lrp/AsnC family transcriptional regulator [Alsobacter soli]PSC06164.1 AsnC family transcriptional regulator [Alsobacter soli]
MANRQVGATLDEIDRRLVELLRKDSRMPAATLARALSVSRGTVMNRIARLTREGVILGFTARLASETGAGVRALIMLEARSVDIKPVVGALKRLPEATRIFSTTGRWDLAVELIAHDLASLDQAISAIRSIRGVSHSETSILLTEL